MFRSSVDCPFYDQFSRIKKQLASPHLRFCQNQFHVHISNRIFSQEKTNKTHRNTSQAKLTIPGKMCFWKLSQTESGRCYPKPETNADQLVFADVGPPLKWNVNLDLKKKKANFRRTCDQKTNKYFEVLVVRWDPRLGLQVEHDRFRAVFILFTQGRNKTRNRVWCKKHVFCRVQQGKETREWSQGRFFGESSSDSILLLTNTEMIWFEPANKSKIASMFCLCGSQFLKSQFYCEFTSRFQKEEFGITLPRLQRNWVKIIVAIHKLLHFLT